MRASRLLSILMLLQTRGRMSAEALAAEVEVSVRTIYRDIDQLSAAGVPVYAERGCTGGFALLDGWRTRLTGLTAPEAQALFLAGLPGPASELGLGEVMQAAQLKLLAALPTDWQADARRVSARFHLDPVGWFSGPRQVDHLPAIAEAVWTDRRLKVRYESWNAITSGEIEPFGLVLKAGIWYLVARAGGKLRTYRLSNILELTVLDAGFHRPATFDLAQHWTASTQSFETQIYRDTALLRASPRGLKLLAGLSPAVADAIARAPKTADARGWIRVVIPIESVEHAAQELLRLHAEAEVLEPAALRQRLGDTARQLAALYAGAPTQRGRRRS
ncbi:YafY family protein [Reyranella sp. CPCC 100927]|uniref:helix-turn-helix transcriptional regulator n=1 Tax=Reyranella sp. CPCC 100927 TaxID=2599616 RepID=UPI0011B3C4A1|nr:YafY family protein [Reyranella sp. CPCC 100927]TWT06071.1 YafY family transcriptional regulator [Reyranella sp. CPCC 100927]